MKRTHGISSPGVSIVVVVFQRVGERGVYRERGAWYAVAVRCPGAEVGHLASFRAEGAPGIAFPRGGLATEGATHARHYTMLNLRIGQGERTVCYREGCAFSILAQASLSGTVRLKTSASAVESVSLQK